MNCYRLVYRPRFHKSLKKIDRKDAERIVLWIVKNLDETTDPRHSGRSLEGNLKGYWRYRVGKYRIIAEVQDSELILLFLDVAKREDVYRHR
jgi:mRNA interferase RelE/StbE